MQASHPISASDASLAGRALGAMIFAFFGAVMLEAWDQRVGAGLALCAAIAVLGLALLARAYLRYRRFAPALALQRGTPETKRAGRIFNIVNIGQWVLILVVGNVLANVGLGEWVVPMAIGVIGLHFIPLAHVFRNPAHYVLGVAQVAFAIAYPLVAAGGPADPVGFLGSGLLLWTSALWALRGRQASPA